MSGLHGASTPDAAEAQARSARSSQASLHTLGSAGSASGRAHAGDARPRAPASAWDPQQRHSDAGRSAELSSGDGSGMRLHTRQDSPPRASPSDLQAVVPPQGRGGSSMAASPSRAAGGGDNRGFGSLMGGREIGAPAEERDGTGGTGRTPCPVVFGGVGGQEQVGVPICANGVPPNRMVAAPGEGAGAHGGVRRRRGPNPFSPAGR